MLNGEGYIDLTVTIGGVIYSCTHSHSDRPLPPPLTQISMVYSTCRTDQWCVGGKIARGVGCSKWVDEDEIGDVNNTIYAKYLASLDLTYDSVIEIAWGKL